MVNCKKRGIRCLCAALLCAALLCATAGGAAAAVKAGGAVTAADGGDLTLTATGAELTGRSAEEVVSMMGLGWNLGNTFDATGGRGATHETSWGNPKVTKELIHAVKEAGFSVIRIPITWAQELDARHEYKINDAFLSRVKEVVDWCYEEGLFVIINVHHESWLNVRDLDKKYREVGTELAAVWKQIAAYFAEYDQHLIFEGTNEPRMAGSAVEWSGNREGYKAVNYLLAVFAQTVRADGTGHNDERCLMIPGYAASCSGNVMEAVSLPTYDGKVVKNLIASVHCYSPYNFCLKDTQKTFSGADEAEVEAVFKAIKSAFLDHGIPVVMGETSATEKGNTEERVKWAQCMGRCSQAYGIPIVIWDNGSDTKAGGESHAYINRKTCEWNYPTVVAGLFEGAKSTERGSALTGGGSQVAGNAVWSVPGGKKSGEAWKSSFLTMSAKATWFAEGREIGIVYTPGDGGAGEPKVILDSEIKQAWWIPVEPTRYADEGGRKIIWYDYATLSGAMSANKVNDPSELRNFMVITTEPGVTVYEVVVTGDAKLTYMVNGQRYASGGQYPADPESEDWVFEGWYLTKTYEGEYTKDTKLDGDAVVYAKLRLKTDAERAAEITPTAAPTGAPAEATPTAAPSPATAPDKAGQESSGSTLRTVGLVCAGVLAVAVIAVAFCLKRKKQRKE